VTLGLFDDDKLDDPEGGSGIESGQSVARIMTKMRRRTTARRKEVAW